MAQTDTDIAMQSPNQQQSGKVCSGDCLRCSAPQRVYCSAQHGRAVMVMVQGMQEMLQKMDSLLADLDRKLSSMQSVDADLFNPLNEKDTMLPNR